MQNYNKKTSLFKKKHNLLIYKQSNIHIIGCEKTMYLIVNGFF